MANETQLKDPLQELLDPLAFHQGGADLGQVVPMQTQHLGQAGATVTGFDIITAQRGCPRRDMTRILANMKALARAAGKDYVYGWEVNDRKNNRKVWIEGPTINLANDLAREYGNNQIDCRVFDEGAHWVFYARFVDLETGASQTRAYQQRKGQNTGMKDDQRALDMIFQIGQSKAIRNVVVNALRSLVNYCVEEAKNSLLEKVGKNPDGARQWIQQQLKKLGIDQKRVEALYGRTAEHWTAPDMARIYTELQSIIDGMMNAEDVYSRDQETSKDDAPKEPRKKQSTSSPGAAADAPQGAASGTASASGGEDQTRAAPKKATAPVPPAGAMVHFFDERKTPLGALPYREGIATGADITLGDAKLHISEFTASQDPMAWIAQCVPVVAESIEGTGKPPADLMDKADESTGPAAPKPRAKRGSVNFGDAT